MIALYSTGPSLMFGDCLAPTIILRYPGDTGLCPTCGVPAVDATNGRGGPMVAHMVGGVAYGMGVLSPSRIGTVMGSRVALALRRAWFLRPWGGHTHIRATARCSEDEWDTVVDVVAEAAHQYDEELFCSGNYDTHWRIATVDVHAYRMRRRASEALRARVRTALVDQQPSGLTSLCRRCRCLEESP